ncbi:hypothetical protein FIBSPDRAFT_945971 [Athelia psychrophila]|uniref:Uncharacterized protein n=1 Tax=Athelia psychrophila TaxID=1759441 RepID=A0A166TI14_9AGAM|nr:hypothetical protein FIBSPDRAFT_945971 [Fibularhizoctonia sp. CBS 109695]
MNIPATFWPGTSPHAHTAAPHTQLSLRAPASISHCTGLRGYTNPRTGSQPADPTRMRPHLQLHPQVLALASSMAAPRDTHTRSHSHLRPLVPTLAPSGAVHPPRSRLPAPVLVATRDRSRTHSHPRSQPASPVTRKWALLELAAMRPCSRPPQLPSPELAAVHIRRRPRWHLLIAPTNSQHPALAGALHPPRSHRHSQPHASTGLVVPIAAQRNFRMPLSAT